MALNRIFRTAFMAGAAAAACWTFNTVIATRKQNRANLRKSEIRTAVKDWENEGGAILTPSMAVQA